PAREAVASGARRGDEVVTRILPLRHADAGGLVPVLQPLVSKDGLLTAYPPTNSLVVVDAGGNVERLGGLVADLDVPSSERATEVVTLRFAPADETALGLGYDGGMGQRPPAMPVSAEAGPAAPGTPAAIPLAAPVRLTADPATNSLIVSATPADWETLRGVIEQLDVRRRQVFVEAIILEATAEKTRALGVEFQGGAKLGGERGLAQANLGTLAGALADPTS